MKLASRRKRRGKKPAPRVGVFRAGPNAVRTFENLKPEDHPYHLPIFGFAPAGKLVGANAPYNPLVEFNLLPPNDWSMRQARAGRFKIEYHMDSTVFARVIAKIAHSFAASVLGLNTFRHELVPFILGEEQNFSMNVGGYRIDDDNRKAIRGVLHTIRAELQGDLFLVHLRLFAYVEGTPNYLIVVGSRQPTITASMQER